MLTSFSSVPFTTQVSPIISSPKAEAGIITRQKPLADLKATKAPLYLVTSKVVEVVTPSDDTTQSNVEVGLVISTSQVTPLLAVPRDQQHNSRTDGGDTKDLESVLPLDQPKNKNAKKQKKTKKSANKVETSRDVSSSTTTPTTPSLADIECTSLTCTGSNMPMTEVSSLKPSVSPLSHAGLSSNTKPCDSEISTGVFPQPASLMNQSSPKDVAKDGNSKMGGVSNCKATQPSTPPEVSTRTGHKRSKTGGSSSKSSSGLKDDKKEKSLVVSNVVSIDSSGTGSVRKADAKPIVTKNNGDSIPQISNDPDRQLSGANTASGISSPGDGQEGLSPIPGNLKSSTEWPALAPTKSPQSSIADGKPPRLPSIPTLNFRRATEVIAPALPRVKKRPSP